MKAPDKGSFPLDHFKECDQFALKYEKCLQNHQLLPKKCRELQKQYLECRMNAGLMDKEEMTKLGFTEQSTWDSEEQEKKFLFEKINMLKQKAKESYRLKQERFKKMEQENQKNQEQQQSQ